MLWAAYSALAEVEESRENCKRAIDACQTAIRIYDRISPAEHADALKNLGYSFITLAEMEDNAKNCRKAIDAYESALQYYTLETAPLEHAEILRDLAFGHVTLSAGRRQRGVLQKGSQGLQEGLQNIPGKGGGAGERGRSRSP